MPVASHRAAAGPDSPRRPAHYANAVPGGTTERTRLSVPRPDPGRPDRGALASPRQCPPWAGSTRSEDNAAEPSPEAGRGRGRAWAVRRTPRAAGPLHWPPDRSTMARVSPYRPRAHPGRPPRRRGGPLRRPDRAPAAPRRRLPAGWSYRELDRRSRLVAWRLRSRGLQPGERLLTWSPSGPELAAVYFGAMRARLILVPLDLRMAPDAIGRIAARSDARQLVIGTGREAPDPARGRSRPPPDHDHGRPLRRARGRLPGRLGGAGRLLGSARRRTTSTSSSTPRARPAPRRAWSSPTGTPWPASTAFHAIVPDMEYRVVSFLPLSHLFEQAIGLYLTLDLGRRHPLRPLPEPARPAPGDPRAPDDRDDRRPPVPRLRLGGPRARGGEPGPDGALRAARSHRPPAADRAAAIRLPSRRSTPASGASVRLFVSAGAFLPPAVQQAWEDIGVVVMQGYGATETGSGAATTWREHPLGCVGWPIPGVEMRIADDGEVLFRGPTRHAGLLGGPGGDGRRVHRGRLLPDRRPRATSTRRAGSSSTAARRT